MRRIPLLLAAILMTLPFRVWAAAPADDVAFYGPCWADASGSNGKGGVSIVTVGKDHKFVLRQDASKGKTGTEAQIVFDSDNNNGNCLSFEFTWVTTAADKFWGNKWAGSGLAFNNSWGSLDLSQDKYLVFYAKTNAPGADFNVALTGEKDGVQTGNVKLSDFAEGHKIGENWTQVVIPFASLPDSAKMTFNQVKTIRFDLIGDYPENKLTYIRLDKVYFTAAKLVTPVENLGWLRVPGAVMVMWDKSNDDGIGLYKVTVDGKLVGEIVGAGKRRVRIPAATFPGPGPHVVGVAAANAKQMSSFQSVTVTAPPPALAANVALSAQLGHPISPYIFGFNYVASDTLKKTGGTLNRWGGNDTTGYNWKDDADNHGSDWVFLNSGGPVGIAEKDKRYYKFVQDTLGGGASPIITIPITGWVAKAPPAGAKIGSFPLSLFPGQTAGGEPGLGKGELPGGKLVWGNDPNTNYLPNSVEFEQEWVKTLVQDFGGSSKGGIRLYQMDNEPGLWRWTHRDVVPKGVGYDELVELNSKYAAAVKAVDPGCQVIGWTAWGVMELAGSNWDYMPGGVKGYQLPDSAMTEDLKWTDRKAHGNVPQVVYFLREMANRSRKAGVRLIDYMDFHGFPEVWGKDQNGRTIKLLTDDTPYDPVVCQKQFDALRVFWDPTLESPDSWCDNAGNKPYLWDPFVGIIPKMKKIVAENFPGTKLAMTEYYPSSKSYYHGGLLEAVNLGIFMREGMDLACDWDGTHDGNYVFWGHKLFSNFDDKGSRVGGNYVPSSSSSGDLYSFAAKQGLKTFVVLVNKNHDTDLVTTITLPAAATSFNTYTLAESSGKRLFDSGPMAATGAALRINVPAFSAVLVVAQ